LALTPFNFLYLSNCFPSLFKAHHLKPQPYYLQLVIGIRSLTQPTLFSHLLSPAGKAALQALLLVSLPFSRFTCGKHFSKNESKSNTASFTIVKKTLNKSAKQPSTSHALQLCHTPSCQEAAVSQSSLATQFKSTQP